MAYDTITKTGDRGTGSSRTWRSTSTAQLLAVCGVLLSLAGAGCSTFSSSSAHGIDAIPASRLPAEVFPPPRSEMIQISMDRLRQEPPEVYSLDKGDVLGIYIENVVGEVDELPPVHFPDDPTRAPVVGFPVPVREDGTIVLPYIEPLDVSGMSVIDVAEKIRRAYTTDLDEPILKSGEDQILVDLIQRRVTKVLVVREESGLDSTAGASSGRRAPRQSAAPVKRGSGYTLELPAYENDLLHALNETGGLPGLDAKNEILIFRGFQNKDGIADAFIQSYLGTHCDDPCRCRPPIPPPPGTTIIPLRYYPDNPPPITERDILLHEGDIVLVQSRDDETFYTGGILPGGEHLLPRDRDIDVLQAIAIAGGPVSGGGLGLGGQGGGGGFGGQGGGGTGCAPSQAIILRQTCSGQIPILVDLNEALTDPGQRILIQKNDVIIVRYSFGEEVGNAFLNIFQFNFLLNGR